MIALAGLLILVAGALLVGGLGNGETTMLWGSVGVSALAGVVLVLDRVRRARAARVDAADEERLLPAEPVAAGARAATASTPPAAVSTAPAAVSTAPAAAHAAPAPVPATPVVLATVPAPAAVSRAEPVDDAPTTVQPAATEPAAAAGPVASEPAAAAGPVATEPDATESAVIESAATEPAAAESAAAEPARDRPAAVSESVVPAPAVPSPPPLAAEPDAAEPVGDPEPGGPAPVAVPEPVAADDPVAPRSVPAAPAEDLPAVTGPVTASHAPRSTGVLGEDGEPVEEDVVVTDLLLILDLTDEVEVVDEHPRYHLAGCSVTRGEEVFGLPLDEAKEDGFTACGICRPDRNLADAERRRRAAAKA